MITKATLKKPWRSPRERLYPEGTVFKLDKRLYEIDGAIYNFEVPGSCYGFVVFPNSIFKSLSTLEKKEKRLRSKIRKDHIKKFTKLL
jgi:hypothetical protein